VNCNELLKYWKVALKTDRGLKNTLADYDKSMTNTITVLSDRISELNEMTEALADSAKALRKSRSL